MKFTIHHYSELESTQTTAKYFLLEENAEEGTVIIADQQTTGYGRQGKKWESPVGNLYFSLILKPEDKPLSDYGQLGFVIAVAVQKALHALFSSLSLSLKWPNDILIEHKKVGGIIIEAEQKGVVIGMGININSAPDAAISLNDCNVSMPETEEVLKAILKSVWETYSQWLTDGFDTIKESWTKYAYQLGEMIERNDVKGQFIGISDEGAMLVKDKSGLIQKVTTVL
jgi:BirA family biotin operon repressor/biotin-[acetyl-CoA-carboxylase] ligase